MEALSWVWQVVTPGALLWRLPVPRSCCLGLQGSRVAPSSPPSSHVQMTGRCPVACQNPDSSHVPSDPCSPERAGARVLGCACAHAASSSLPSGDLARPRGLCSPPPPGSPHCWGASGWRGTVAAVVPSQAALVWSPRTPPGAEGQLGSGTTCQWGGARRQPRQASGAQSGVSERPRCSRVARPHPPALAAGPGHGLCEREAFVL